MNYSPPKNQTNRSEILRAYDILDTAPEPTYDALIQFLAGYCQMPTALISIVDDDRQWFKSRVGLNATETPRSVSFCTHAIESDQSFIVEDATLDPRFAKNPLVVGEPHIRFYAGAPLIGSSGFRMGTVCLIDQNARKLTPEQNQLLTLIAGQVSTLLELRKSNAQLLTVAAQAKVREAEIRRISERQGALLASLHAGILVETPDRSVLLFNPVFAEMFGLPETETYIGRPSTEVFAKIARLFKQPETLASEPTASPQTMEFELNDGRFIEREEVLITSDSPSSGGSMSIFRDITERRRMELFVASQRLQMAEILKLKVLGEMAGNISHEINNPMTIIHGRATLLKELAQSGRLDSKIAHEYADAILYVVKRVSTIIQGLRTISRSGEQDSSEKVPIRSLLEETLAFCQEKFKTHSVDLRIPSIPDGAAFQGRRVQLSQVLLNLISNAFDAVVDQKERWIEIEIIAGPQQIEISIADSGPGIPKEVRARLFEPFFTTKFGNKGTGLGLSISRGIAEDHGGSLRLDEGERTRFRLNLPIATP